MNKLRKIIKECLIETIADKDAEIASTGNILRSSLKIRQIRTKLEYDLMGIAGSSSEEYDAMRYVTKFRTIFNNLGKDELALKLLRQVADENEEIKQMFGRVFGNLEK